MENRKSTSIVYSVTKELRNAILNGTLKKGDRLIQDEWAKKLNVSRMPIREALTQLEIEGLVKIVSHRGAVVTPIMQDDFEEIYQTRAYLEGLVVTKSLPYLTLEDKEELRHILEEMEALHLTDETNDQYISLNSSFHKTLRKRCPWTRVCKVLESFGISPIAPSLLVDYYEKTQEEHRRIYEAILRGDPTEVRLAVEYHILHTKNNLIEYLEILNKKEKMDKSTG